MRSTASALACLTAIYLGACGSESEPILIGLAGPFSQSRGVSMQLGAQLAITEINQNGGVGGRLLELVVRDDSAEAAVALRVAQDLYRTPGLVVVVGHLTSGATIAAAPVYNGGTDPVVVISPSASSPILRNAGEYTFRICPGELVHAKRLAEWAWSRLRARSAAVLYRNDAYGRGLRSAFSRSFAALGGVVAATDPYLPATPTFEPYLSRLKMRGAADVLVIGGTATDAERILPELESVNLAPAILGGDGLSGLEASDVNTTGVFISSAYLPDRPDPRNRDFVAAYRRAYGHRLPDHRGAGAYDIVYLLARALDAVGANRKKLRDYVAGIGTDTPPFVGVTGTVAFDKNGDVPHKPVLIGVVRNQRLVTAPAQ